MISTKESPSAADVISTPVQQRSFKDGPKSLLKIPLIVAHRGGRFWQAKDFSYITESIDSGADVIELDVRELGPSRYLVQHDRFSRPQGWLEDALARMAGRNVSLYLDIKSRSSDARRLIEYVRQRTSCPLIVGSFHLAILDRLADSSVRTTLHCRWPYNAIDLARRVNADWITPMFYFTTEELAREIQVAGFKFAPAGNYFFKRYELFDNQIRYARWGAHAVSTHHVREMRTRLEFLM
jgi:glycerophosphoryl diester phosphodiesterase